MEVFIYLYFLLSKSFTLVLVLECKTEVSDDDSLTKSILFALLTSVGFLRIRDKIREGMEVFTDRKGLK